jgi:hypothetical protein
MSINLIKKSKRFKQEAGVALLTTLLLLFLLSSLLVGFSVLLMSNQRLSGSNNDQVSAFYGAEAGMEELTAGLGNLFSATYSPNIGQINALETTPPVIPGVQFITGSGNSGYQITPLYTDSLGNPAPSITTIKSGTYNGMTALATDYTLMVNARTPQGREVTLKRTTQTVGIPMFQFGIFCGTDCDFFPGPTFNFGGRLHTNGNLFLAAGSNLYLSDKVDAYKDVIRTNLENGYPVNSNYAGNVEITTSPGGSNYRALATTEGSLKGTLGSPGNFPTWSNLSLSSTAYAGNLCNGPGSSDAPHSTCAKLLNLGIVTIGNGTTQPIDIIRRSYPAEPSTVTAERYYSQASLRVLFSDDPTDIMNLPCIDGGTQPFDLSKIAVAPNLATGAPWTTAGYYAPAAALYNQMIANNVTPLALAASGATNAWTSGGNATYTPSDGYWLPNGYPVIKGFIKIEEQLSYGNPCGTWKDVTVEILGYGYVGRNINPVPQSLDGINLNPFWTGTTTAMDSGQAPAITRVPVVLSGGATPTLTNSPQQYGAQNPIPTSYMTAGTFTAANLYVAGAAAPAGTCMDPHPNAVIRLERIRDNPTSLQVLGFVATGTQGTPASNKPRQATVAAVCGVDPATGKLVAGWTPTAYDFWPNTLFDPREGTLRDNAMDTDLPARPTLNGVMHYTEIDAKNLANWFAGKLGGITTSGQSTKDPAVAPNNYVVYVSDRRGNYAGGTTFSGGWPPLSYTKNETGEYGWNDIVNGTSAATTGCPNNSMDTGEDPNTGSTFAGQFYTYGASQSYIHAAGAPNTTLNPLLPGQLGIFKALSGNALTNNSSCPSVPSYASDGIWPMMVATDGTGVQSTAVAASAAASARENPPLFFRRAVKLINGNLLTAVGPCPGGVSCGLTFASENPVYIQGDYNANSGGNGWNDPSIATSVVGDAVTLLSDNWNDINSFSSPYAQTARQGSTSWYRTAIIGGVIPYFPQPAGTGNDYGTDGGVHNFLRYIETWSGTLNYEGSMINLYYGRQAIGTFKCCNTVYNPPTRGYNFDNNFLNPTLLPPRTPLFRDVNTTGWTRLLLAGQYQ